MSWAMRPPWPWSLFLVIAVLVLLFKGVLERKMKKIY